MATVTLIESTWSRRFEKHCPPLSAQMLVDYIHKEPLDEKRDNPLFSVVKALDWLTRNEVYGEAEYPYMKKRGECQSSIVTPSVRMKIKDYHTITGEQRGEIQKILERHHVAAVIDVYLEFLHLKDKIYEGPNEDTNARIGRHAIVIVGYGFEGQGSNAKNFWLVMNSWGLGWGVAGFGRVYRDTTRNGKFLLRRISYPKFEDEYEYLV
ncbi:hypothetical protein REPUB_Repub03eG0069200 [Reevesia pubescens]